MTKSDHLYPSEKAERIIVRLPDGMRGRLAAAAKANNRSTNAEVVARLEESFEMGEVGALDLEQFERMLAGAVARGMREGRASIEQQGMTDQERADLATARYVVEVKRRDKGVKP